VPRLQELLQRRPAPGNWPQFIAANVDRFKSGRAEDDVLVAAITFSSARRTAAATMART